VCALAASVDLNPEVLSYLNRLSDLLFVAARALARRRGGSETLWQRNDQR
jgi:cob(I)alamin adenosyltransferase